MGWNVTPVNYEMVLDGSIPEFIGDEVNTVVMKAGEKLNITASTIREHLKIPFFGKVHPVSLFIIDCKAELYLPPDEMCFSFSDVSTSGFFPMKENRKRIDGVIPKELEGNKHITFEDIEKKFAERLHMKIRLYKPEWFSVAPSQQGYALSYQQNRCFLVGDAAHTFTPVGAQGMNTGLQDAYNLAWKLAFVIQGKAKSTLLNTYSAERQNIAKKLVRSTGRIYTLVTSQNIFIKSFRLHLLPHLMKWILPFIAKQKFFREFCFNAISQLGINYRKSTLSLNASFGNFPSNAPQPGDRLPFLVFNENDKEINIQDKINGKCFTLLIFTKHPPSLENEGCTEKYKNVLSYETIQFKTKTKFLFEHFGIEDSSCYLVRPDMYIAYRSAQLNGQLLDTFLQQFLLVP